MLRVKKIASFSEWEQEFFAELDQKKYVLCEYNSKSKQVVTGDLLVATHSRDGVRETFPAMCTHFRVTFRRHGWGKSKYRYDKYHILYRLTDEGLSFVKEKLVEQRL
jgi:hypothetical protein